MIAQVPAVRKPPGPGPSHAPPEPCAGSIVAGPRAPDGRNRGSHAAPAGKTVVPPRIGGEPSRAVSVGCSCPGPSHAPPEPCAGSIAAGPVGAPDRRNRGSHAVPAGKTVATPRIGGGPSRAVSVGCSCPGRPAVPRDGPRVAASRPGAQRAAGRRRADGRPCEQGVTRKPVLGAATCRSKNPAWANRAVRPDTGAVECSGGAFRRGARRLRHRTARTPGGWLDGNRSRRRRFPG